MRGARTRRGLLVAVLVGVLAVLTLTPAADAGARPHHLARLTTDMFKTLFLIPASSADHPYHKAICLRYDHVVAGFQDGTQPEFSCYVQPGTPVLIGGYFSEASTVEVGDPNASETTLRTAALEGLGTSPDPTVRFDGRRLRLKLVVGPLATVRLPAKNLLDAPAGPISYVAVGLVALVHPSPGCHAITIKAPDADPTKPTTYIQTYLQVGHRVDCDLESANPR